jgi:hypothetical protein
MSALISIFVVVLISAGSAFAPLPPHAAMVTGNFSSGVESKTKTKPISAEVTADSEHSQPSNNVAESIIPRLREASGNSSIPSIKLGGAHCHIFSFCCRRKPRYN